MRFRRKDMLIKLSKHAILCTTLLLAGCYSIGPKQIQLDRSRYNDILNETDNEQLLKNIVRIRYLENTSYMEVSNVTAGYSLNSSISATPSWSAVKDYFIGAPIEFTKTADVEATPNIAYSDTPTISYRPIDSKDFLLTMLRPLNFNNLLLLFRTGAHDPSKIITLTFDRIGKVENAIFSTSFGATTVTQDDKNNLLKFKQFLSAINRLYYQKRLVLEPINYEKTSGIVLVIKGDIYSKDAITIKKLLQVPLESRDIILLDSGLTSTLSLQTGVLSVHESEIKNTALVRVRSIHGIMTFLSYAVQVPEPDLKANMVIRTRDSQGGYFNWNELVKDYMKIYSSDQYPKDAYVRTKLHNHWFYIKNSDHNSKVTFTILQRLVLLSKGQSDVPAQAAPLLTIPVNTR